MTEGEPQNDDAAAEEQQRMRELQERNGPQTPLTENDVEAGRALAAEHERIRAEEEERRNRKAA